MRMRAHEIDFRVKVQQEVVVATVLRADDLRPARREKSGSKAEGEARVYIGTERAVAAEEHGEIQADQIIVALCLQIKQSNPRKGKGLQRERQPEDRTSV